MAKVGQLELGVAKRPSKNGGRWGGRREGAGRKPANGVKAGVAHRRRAAPTVRTPMHVTFRLKSGLPRMRQRRGYQIVKRAIGVANRFDGAWISEVSIQHNHVHLIVEARDQKALTRGMKSFAGSLAKNINRGAGRYGEVIEDRYHAVILRTPAQVRRALA